MTGELKAHATFPVHNVTGQANYEEVAPALIEDQLRCHACIRTAQDRREGSLVSARAERPAEKSLTSGCSCDIRALPSWSRRRASAYGTNDRVERRGGVSLAPARRD
jgi:hypothetical protein